MMSRKILVASFVAALALVGCDDSSSSSTTTPAAGTCDGYKGHWVADTTISEGGMSFGMKIDLTLTATTFNASIFSTQGTTTTPVGTAMGSVKDIGSSKLVTTATKVTEMDEETGALVTSTDPEDFTPDTLMYSFPAKGKMRLSEVGETDGSLETYTCM